MVAHDYSDEVITQCVARVWERKTSLSQLTKRSASEFLISRTRRANTGWEETKEGNLEQECCEEFCDYEETREIFETNAARRNFFWTSYQNGPPKTTTPLPTTLPLANRSNDASYSSGKCHNTVFKFYVSLQHHSVLSFIAHVDILLEAGFPIWAIVLIIALSLALFIVIIFILIQHRKKKKSSKDSNPLLGENANNHITLTRNTNSFHAFQAKGANAIQHSSSSRSHSTALSSGSSGGGPPPGYSETMDRNATLRSQDSGVLSGASSSASNFIIRDPKLRSKLEKCLLDRNRLQIGDLIKEGNFGAVYRGTLNNHGRREMVAVKTLKVFDDNVSFEEFMKEGVLTKDFEHVNVLKLIGVCMSQSEPPYLLLPFCEHGDLRTYLRNPKNIVVVADLVKFGRGVACGMKYLAERNFVHRDLAARNCMLDSKMNVKVSDFGLTRETNNRDYYRSQRVAELPLKWMAPESIKFNFYNEKTDVWAFGVTLWEIMTRGQIPYSTIEPQKILTHIESDNRMTRPDHCPPLVYDIMELTWASQADERPKFKDILPMFDNVLNQSNQQKQRNRLSEQPRPRSRTQQPERSKTERPINHPRYVPEWTNTTDRSDSRNRSGSRTGHHSVTGGSRHMSQTQSRSNTLDSKKQYTTLHSQSSNTMRSHR